VEIYVLFDKIGFFMYNGSKYGIVVSSSLREVADGILERVLHHVLGLRPQESAVKVAT
jgi:hypothetical protein